MDSQIMNINISIIIGKQYVQTTTIKLSSLVVSTILHIANNT